jgi:predicted nucleotidyltransferase
MSVIAYVMVFGDVMKHVAQELSEKGRSDVTSVILCGSFARCFFSSLKTADSCLVLTREESCSLKFVSKVQSSFANKCTLY